MTDSEPTSGGTSVIQPPRGDTGVRRFSTSGNWGRTILLSVVVGMLAGFAARLLEWAVHFGVDEVIGRFAEPGEPGFLDFSWWIVGLPVAGGLLSGVVVAFLCKPNKAHGTAVLIDAFHHRGGEMSLRDSFLKAAAAAAVISLGGSVGKEAAIAVLGASIGTALTGALGMTARERRIFLIAGTAAGVGAIFQCPLGAALFACGVLYREPEIETDGLVPSVVASVTSYSTFMAFGGFGQRLLQGTHTLTFHHPVELLPYAVLGILCAGTSILFFYCLKFGTWVPAKLKLPAWLAPGVAGLAVGLIACVLPQVMDSRYEFIQGALDGVYFQQNPQTWLWWGAFFSMIVVAKCVATSMMVGANTAGGLFGPVVFIGGAVGAATGALLEVLFPGSIPEDLREALIPVGMAGVLAASLRTPLAAVVMVIEMTGSYGLIVPLMLVSVVAYVLGRRWGVYAEQVRGPEHSPAHAGESMLEMLEAWKVSDLADRAWKHVVQPGTRLTELVSLMPTGTRPTFAVLDGRRLVGHLSTADIANALDLKQPNPLIVAADMMAPVDLPLRPDDSLYSTLDVFRRRNADVLPVVDEETGHFAGMLTRAAILDAIRKRVSEQRKHLLREHRGLAALDHEDQIEDLLSELTVRPEDNIQRISVPTDVIGKSLREADFRRRHKAQVIAVETAGGDLQTPPDPGRPLTATDVLIVIYGRR